MALIHPSLCHRTQSRNHHPTVHRASAGAPSNCPLLARFFVPLRTEDAARITCAVAPVIMAIREDQEKNPPPHTPHSASGREKVPVLLARRERLRRPAVDEKAAPSRRAGTPNPTPVPNPSFRSPPGVAWSWSPGSNVQGEPLGDVGWSGVAGGRGRVNEFWGGRCCSSRQG